jgi:cytochrome c-type biogenesis protein CcmE
VEGTMVPGGHFQSTRLMVSHNNEYKVPDKAHPLDEKQLRKMIESADASQGN